MAPVSIALPEHLQLQSPLVCLPTEIKHIIFGYCFAADGPIVDPVVGCTPPEGEIVPKIGINVLRTCRRIYHETDRHPLIAENTFRFTTVNRVRSFLQSIGKELSTRVQDIEIDARRVGSEPKVGDQWLDYLAEGSTTWRKDAPELKCLRLNLESWPSIPMSRTKLWNFLRTMLSSVDGLERVVVVGASKGKGMAMREPWSPVHFVGGDDVGPHDLVERMRNTIKKSNEQGTIVRWERRDGKLYLEVVSRAYLVKHVDSKWAGPYTREKHTDPWPENGSCTWFEYLNRHSDVTDPRTKGINPNAAE